MVTFLLLFTNRKSFQSISFSLWESREPGAWGGVHPPTPPTLGHPHTHCMSIWTWSCRCWASWGPPWHGAVLRKLSR